MDEESQKEIRCTNTITNNDYALPNPKLLKWAHSTCSKHELNRAMRDKSITAIEADIVWGHEENGEEDASLTLNPDEQLQPIMAHPPSFISDLTFERFIATAFAKDHDSAEVDEYKHLKLDFKDAETIEPVLERLQHALSTSKNDKNIFLNADILEGPGKRNAPLIIEADEFVEKCLTFIDLVGDQNDRMAMRISLSLGWRGDCRSFGGYTVDDIEKMRELIDKYDILKRCGGLVLAVNARLLAKDPAPFDTLLKDYKTIQLLVWTGTGEPPISSFQISSIKKHFCWCEDDQLGFDCQIAKYVVSGIFYDNAVRAVGLGWNVFNAFSSFRGNT